MPLAKFVETEAVDPLTGGLHNIINITTQQLAAPSNEPLSSSVATQIDHSLNTYPSASHTLDLLKQVTSQAIDMASLIHLPAELFISENEWAGARWKDEKIKAAEAEKAKDLQEPNGKGASEYLAFAIKSHQEAQAQGSVGFVQEGPEVFQYVLNHAADVIAELESQRRNRLGKVKEEKKEEENADAPATELEDPLLRDLRLNLLALAKRAPLDKIEKLPISLIPEHIRQYVPTLPVFIP